MDIQHVLDIILSVALALGGWIMKNMNERLNGHDNRFTGLPEVYARRDDVKDMKQEILKAIEGISEKMDRKADKS